MKKIALATYSALPHLNHDDLLLQEAFAQRSIQAEPAIWNETRDWTAYDAVVIRSCWDYVDDLPGFTRWLDHLGRSGVCVINTPEALRWSLDKTYLQELERKGIKTVPTVWLTQDRDAEEILANLPDFRTQRFVLKPCIGNDAKGIRILSLHTLATELRASQPFWTAPKYLLQPFMASVIEEGEWSLVYIGGRWSHCVLKKPAPGDFRSQHTQGGCFEPAEPPRAALEAANAVINVAPPSVYARIDLIRNGHDFVVSEVEMVEPWLYFALHPEAAPRFVEESLKAWQVWQDSPAAIKATPYEEKLDQWYADFTERKSSQIGYPLAQDLDHADMGRFLDLHINNVGDPFGGNNLLNAFDAERDVIGFFSDLLHAPRGDSWGYLTNGGTESNLHGLWAARNRLPNAVVYYSEESHYSIPKILNILGLRGVQIPTHADGTIDLNALRLVARALREAPAIWNANIGTTMKGAVDDVLGGQRAFREAGISHLHIHCDAALSGPMLPFIHDAPAFDFRAGVASIAISGHKFLGSPIPTGVVICRQSVCPTGVHVDYIDAKDTTISGSRDGFATLLLWKTLQKLGRKGLEQRTQRCLEMTQYTLSSLKNVGIEAWSHPYANTVVLPRPSDPIIKKWHLATQGTIAHVILMPGLTVPIIDRFVQDMGSPGAFEPNHAR